MSDEASSKLKSKSKRRQHMNENKEYPRNRIALSIIAGIGWLIFILLFTLFWSTDFSTFQSLMIILISFLIVGALIGLMWIISGIKSLNPIHRD
jgi:hypothetical protein